MQCISYDPELLLLDRKDAANGLEWQPPDTDTSCNWHIKSLHKHVNVLAGRSAETVKLLH